MEDGKAAAALLLAQWKEFHEHEGQIYMGISPRDHKERVAGLSRRLDDLAQKAGIRIGEDGLFWYSSLLECAEKGHILMNIHKGYPVFTPAVEQQAIQEWLLIKNNLK